MDRILLLKGKQCCYSKVKDYLELSGYEVLQGVLEEVDGCKLSFQIAKVILIEGDEIESCIPACVKVRALTNKPIIILSSRGEEWEKVKMFQSGADDYLVSPYLQMELMARIRAHIDRYKRLTQPVGIIRIRDMVINIFTRKVFMCEKYIPLRLKEYDILLYLAQHQNRVVTKEEIYHVIWKTDEFVNSYSNTVAVHIKRIREKVEEDVDNPQYVQTVWGVGYRLIGPGPD